MGSNKDQPDAGLEIISKPVVPDPVRDCEFVDRMWSHYKTSKSPVFACKKIKLGRSQKAGSRS